MMRLLMVLLAFMPLTLSADTGLWGSFKSFFVDTTPEAPPSIKVLLLHNQPGITLEVKGKYQIFDPKTDDKVASRLIGQRRIVQPLPIGLKWGELYPGLHQMKVVPKTEATKILVDGVEYPGSIYVYDVGETISVVNEVELEDYLAYILPNAVKEPLSEEALAAYAIALRTNVYYQIEHPHNPFWTVDTLETKYRGNEKVEDQEAFRKAIHVTKHLVLSNDQAPGKGIKPFPAHWQEGSNQQNVVLSQVSLDEVEKMAQKGKKATDILSYAFPNTSLKRISQ